MAEEEVLRKLRQGGTEWNIWRQKKGRLGFNESDLSNANLRGIDLFGADLSTLKLSNADMRKANLRKASFRYTLLDGADLYGASLHDADLSWTILSNTNLSQCEIGWTTFASVTLSEAKGLDSVIHSGPSSISIDTIIKSRGMIPKAFLIGVGLSDDIITFVKSLDDKEATQYHSCFISYSNKDKKFTDFLYADLQENGVRCWFAPEDMKIGDNIRQRLDSAIQRYDKLLIVLSENSIQSDWVRTEVEIVFERERNWNKAILFPIRLDDSVMKTSQAWAAEIRRLRHIGDFRHWEDPDSYKGVFERLLRDLRVEKKLF